MNDLSVFSIPHNDTDIDKRKLSPEFYVNDGFVDFYYQHVSHVSFMNFHKSYLLLLIFHPRIPKVLIGFLDLPGVGEAVVCPAC
jgi:hypothetical protein